MSGLRARIALATLAVVATALAIVAVGVLKVGGDAFAGLMVASGESDTHAREMFSTTVVLVFGVAAVVAGAGSFLLAGLLARRLARPIERLADAAGRVAAGDFDARVHEAGPSELRALAAAYNAMAARLAEQEAIRREFVVNAAHELRTPLTNLQGYLEALRDGVLPPGPAVFESLREEVDRLTRLATSLDVLAGPEGVAGGRAEPGPLDLAPLIRTAGDLAGPTLARRGVAFDVSADGPLTVHGRADELTQVLANLLQNAVRYTPARGRVRVTAEQAPDGVTVRVANTGPGIPADDLPRVWERFYRVEKSRDRERGGAGIGLAIVKRLVEDAGGRVGASSDAAWTTFWFRLPTAR